MLDFMLSLNRPFDLRGGGIKFSMFPKFQKNVQIILGWGGGKKVMGFFPFCLTFLVWDSSLIDSLDPRDATHLKTKNLGF